MPDDETTDGDAGAARLAVVTGASSGIGRAIALRLIDDGWSVCGLDVAPPTIAHPQFSSRVVDLTDIAATDAVARALAHADGLIHAAGVLRIGALGHLDAQAAELLWRLHVDAAERLANTLVPAMAARGHGRVVLLGSRVAHGMAGRSQYAAVKAAIVALARSWAAEVVARGVTVNVVAPGATATAMLDDPARQAVPPKVPPIGRLIRTSEIAALVTYLLSSAAAPVTGQEIMICGGASL